MSLAERVSTHKFSKFKLSHSTCPLCPLCPTSLVFSAWEVATPTPCFALTPTSVVFLLPHTSLAWYCPCCTHHAHHDHLTAGHHPWHICCAWQHAHHCPCCHIPLSSAPQPVPAQDGHYNIQCQAKMLYLSPSLTEVLGEPHHNQNKASLSHFQQGRSQGSLLALPHLTGFIWTKSRWPSNCTSVSICFQFFCSPCLLWPSNTIWYDKAAAMAYLQIKNQDDNFVYCEQPSLHPYSSLMFALANMPPTQGTCLPPRVHASHPGCMPPTQGTCLPPRVHASHPLHVIRPYWQLPPSMSHHPQAVVEGLFLM